jgi:RNA polymerase-binding transcription factor DksA
MDKKDGASRQIRIEQEIARVDVLLDSAAARLHARFEGSGDMADKAYELTERERNWDRYDRLVQRRGQLEQARARLERGVGHLCETCGAAIDAERLEARAEVTRCRTCQQQLEQRLHRRQGYSVMNQAA